MRRNSNSALLIIMRKPIKLRIRIKTKNNDNIKYYIFVILDIIFYFFKYFRHNFVNSSFVLSFKNTDHLFVTHFWFHSMNEVQNKWRRLHTVSVTLRQTLYFNKGISAFLMFVIENPVKQNVLTIIYRVE